jgi:cytochrome c oxidase assembly protein subunit 15
VGQFAMAETPHLYEDIPPERRLWLGRWIAGWAGMVVMTLVIGGITRLTESGLSITEWAPVSGVIPPLSEAGWAQAFEAYRQIPEFQLNPDMTIEQFKSIYFWEYLHRIWGRLVGLVVAVPFLVLWLKGWFVPKLTRRVFALVVLTGAQGALGWYMVSSGLVTRTDVSQYRLAAHLGLALILYVMALWTAADLLRTPKLSGGGSTGLNRMTLLLVGLVFVTALAGAFVAGIDGGKAYNSFPLMGGRLIPGGYGQLSPWWSNLFENVAAVQFNHRWLGMLTFGAAVGMWLWQRSRPLGQDKYLQLLPAVATGQMLLGVTTLLLVVPIWIAALHQLGAVALLTVSVLLHHSLARAASG